MFCSTPLLSGFVNIFSSPLQPLFLFSQFFPSHVPSLNHRESLKCRKFLREAFTNFHWRGVGWWRQLLWTPGSKQKREIVNKVLFLDSANDQKYFESCVTHKHAPRKTFSSLYSLIKILFSVAYYLLTLNLTIEIWRRPIHSRARPRETHTRRLPSARLHNELS